MLINKLFLNLFPLTILFCIGLNKTTSDIIWLHNFIDLTNLVVVASETNKQSL